MAVKEWVTTYKGASPVQDPDPVNQASVQEDLDDTVDDTRSSQIEEIRDKVDAAARLLGDSANAPVGSLCEILDRDHASGDARQLRMAEIGAAPAAAANKVTLCALDVGGITRPHARLSDGTVVDLSAGGATGVHESQALFSALAGGVSAPGWYGASVTQGVEFSLLTKGCSVLGARFYVPNAAAKNWSVKLWERGNATALRSVTVATSAVGSYEGLFAAPYVVPDGDVPSRAFIVSFWDQAGVHYMSNDPAVYKTQAYIFRNHMLLDRARVYALGDAVPNISHGSASYPIDPIVSGPL